MGGGGKRTSRHLSVMSIQRAGDWSIHKVATEPLQDIREGKLFGGVSPPVRIPSVIVHVIKSLISCLLLHIWILQVIKDWRRWKRSLSRHVTKRITVPQHCRVHLHGHPCISHLRWRSGSGTPSEPHTPSWTSAVS